MAEELAPQGPSDRPSRGIRAEQCTELVLPFPGRGQVPAEVGLQPLHACRVVRADEAPVYPRGFGKVP
jgi:hypothetical protein